MLATPTTRMNNFNAHGIVAVLLGVILTRVMMENVRLMISSERRASLRGSSTGTQLWDRNGTIL